MWLDYLYLTLIDRDCSKPQAKILTRVQIQLQATEKKQIKLLHMLLTLHKIVK